MIEVPSKLTNWVVYYSPGTFVSETTSKKLESESLEDQIQEAIIKAKKIKERHGAIPYGFQLEVRREAQEVLVGGEKTKIPAKTISTSGTYFLTGIVMSAAEVLAGTDPKEDILRSNVRNNEFAAIIDNRNSWRSTMPFGKKDVVVDWDGKIVARGSDYVFPEKLKYKYES